MDGFYEHDEEAFPIIARKKLGQGKLTFLPFSVGNCYSSRKPIALRNLMREAVQDEPIVQIMNTKLVDVALSEEDDGSKKYVHLINNGGIHSSSNPQVFDEVQPLYYLDLKIAWKNAPKKVVLQPSGTELPFVYEDGHIRLTVEKLHIYEILQIE